MKLTKLVLPLLLTAPLCAQQAATYTVAGQGCPGSNGLPPAISSEGLPQVGQRFFVTLADAMPSSSALMTVGNSTSSWLGTPLPFDMGAMGATGCNVYTNMPAFFVLTTSATGTARCPLTVPNDMSLMGVKFFNQFFVADPTANPFGVVSTACGAATVGI